MLITLIQIAQNFRRFGYMLCAHYCQGTRAKLPKDLLMAEDTKVSSSDLLIIAFKNSL
jgi:hypothetical protein